MNNTIKNTVAAIFLYGVVRHILPGRDLAKELQDEHIKNNAPLSSLVIESDNYLLMSKVEIYRSYKVGYSERSILKSTSWTFSKVLPTDVVDSYMSKVL